MVKVNIILPLAVGDNVAHEKYGRGVITGYMVEEIARSSDDVLRTTYTVNFNEAIRGCLIA